MSSEPLDVLAVAHVAHAVTGLAHDGNGSQVFVGRKTLRVNLKVWQRLAIGIDDLVEHGRVALILLPATGRDDQALDVELVGGHQQAHEGLVIVGIGAEVGGDDDAGLVAD